jgi:hypothetical protein
MLFSIKKVFGGMGIKTNPNQKKKTPAPLGRGVEKDYIRKQKEL